MSNAGGLHARTNSIKRTPSDIALALSKEDLPEPSAITKSSSAGHAAEQTNKVTDKLSGLDADEPEGEHSPCLTCPSFELGARLR